MNQHGVISVAIRRNYTRSLSSASFILELRFETDDGKNAAIHLAVSREGCYSADGKIQGNVIYLYPEQKDNDITVAGKSIYSAASLDDLCELLLNAATIEGWQDPMAEYNAYGAKVNGFTFAIDGKLKCYDSHKELTERIEKLGGKVSRTISSETNYLICNDRNSTSRKASKARLLGICFLSDFEFMCGLFGEDLSCDAQEDSSNDAMAMSVTEVAPITIRNFTSACAEAGITLANLKKITIQNNKFGNRDSAMFIFCDNDRFYTYKKMYSNAPVEQKRVIEEEFIAFVKAGPILEVNDNEFELPETMRCVWNGGDAALEEAMRSYLEGGGPGHWMGTYSEEFTIDVTERTVTSREVLFFGNI